MTRTNWAKKGNLSKSSAHADCWEWRRDFGWKAESGHEGGVNCGEAAHRAARCMNLILQFIFLKIVSQSWNSISEKRLSTVQTNVASDGEKVPYAVQSNSRRDVLGSNSYCLPLSWVASLTLGRADYWVGRSCFHALNTHDRDSYKALVPYQS